jgi:hypothetical protein
MRKFMNVAQSSRHGSYAMEEEAIAEMAADVSEDVKEDSLDDAAVADGEEAAGMPAEVDVAIMECFRMEQISDSLEDLAVIADGIEEASPEEVALIRTVSDMAVAGTDVESEEIVPETVVPLQLEVSGAAGNVVTEGRFIGRRISTEGIRETARTIWEAIKKFLKDIWAKIEKFFYKIFGTIPMLRRKVEALKKRADELSSSGKKPGKEKITISSGVKALSIGFTPITSAATLSTEIDNLNKGAKWVYTTYASKLAKLGEEMATVVGDFDPMKASDSATKMAGLLNDTALEEGFINKSSKIVNGYSTNDSAEVLGSQVFEYRSKNHNEQDKADQTAAGSRALVYASNFEIRMKDSKETGTVKDSFEIKPFESADIEEMCSKMLKLLDSLEEFKRGPGFKKITSAKEKLQKAADKAETSFAKIKDRSKAEKDDTEGQAEENALPIYRALINTNTSFAKWTSSPTMSYFKHCITEINAIVAVSSRSLSTYTSK